MENRKEKRVQQSREITLEDGDQTYTAYLVDISRKGMSIRTEGVFPTYKVIDIFITINDQPLILKGSVRWVNERIDKEKIKLNEIGLLLINPPKEYLTYFDKLAS